MTARLPALVLALILAAASREARASCRSATECLCNRGRGVVDGVIESVDGPRVRFVARALRGDTGTWKGGDAITLPRNAGDAAGSRCLLFVWGDGVGDRIPVSADGNVTCAEAEPDFVISAADAVDVALAADCADRLHERGFTEPPCRDTGGCASAGGAAAALIGAPLAFARRRRAT